MLAKLYVTNHPRVPFLVRYTDPLRRDASGRPKRIPKRFADREKAEEYCTNLNKRLAIVGTSGLVFDHQLRAQALSAKGKLEAAGFKDSIDTIVERYIREHPITIGATADAFEMMDKFIEEKRYAENKSEETCDDLEKRITRWLRNEAITVMNQITAEAAGALRIRKSVSPKTRSNDINACAGFCAWAKRAKKLAVDPFEDMERPTIERNRPRAWTAEEVTRVMQATRGYRAGKWLRAVVLAVFAGVRPSEAKQAQIVLERKSYVRVEGGKLRGRANRIVPLAKNAGAWLKAAPADQPLALTMRARQTIARMANVKWWVDAPRHTFISNRLALIHDQAKVAMEAGNSPDIIFRHYAALRTEREAKAFWGLMPVNKSRRKTK